MYQVFKMQTNVYFPLVPIYFVPECIENLFSHFFRDPTEVSFGGFLHILETQIGSTFLSFPSALC